MIAMPPPALEQCVKVGSPHADHVRALTDLVGPAADVAAVLAKAKPDDAIIVADVMEASGRRVTLRYTPVTSYKQIGAFIYAAQSKGLTMTGRFDPPICEENK